MKGKLYLIPATIGDGEVNKVIPKYVAEVINSLDFFIVENERTARRYLIKAGLKRKIDDLTFYLINKHTEKNHYRSYLEPLDDGNDVGMLSEAGVPAVADPGAEIVSIAHEMNCTVVPLVGPSSILLALMASGMNGQNFCFHGYLPIRTNDRIRKILEIELNSGNNNQTQIFIEAPYRNNQLLKDMLSACKKNTLLCIAAEITGQNEFIKTKSIGEWRRKMPELHKKPAIFLLLGAKRKS